MPRDGRNAKTIIEEDGFGLEGIMGYTNMSRYLLGEIGSSGRWPLIEAICL